MLPVDPSAVLFVEAACWVLASGGYLIQDRAGYLWVEDYLLGAGQDEMEVEYIRLYPLSRGGGG